MKKITFIWMFLCVIQTAVAHKSINNKGLLTTSNWTEAVLETKKLVMERAKTDKILFDSLNVDSELRELQLKFPNEMSALMPYVRSNVKGFLSGMDGTPEVEIIAAVTKNFKNTAWFETRIKELKQERDAKARISGLLDLFFIASEIRNLDEQLEWLNVTAVMAAFEDMKSDKSFNLAEASSKLDELKSLVKLGFSGIYKNDRATVAAARKALQLKKAILLSHPALDVDRILVSRYKIGANARLANSSAMGTQPNNWSNQSSAPRGGFNAEIAELSDLRGNLKYRTIFKPENSSSVPDLKLHWDARRLMFSMTDNTNRWQVYEVGIDGNGLRKVIESPEEDLEFFDAAYLPNNKVVAVTNIGYHGVPCVSGGDAVGNMVLYNPQDGKMRRITFDQDANWHPNVMNNGRLMYVRWEYTDLTHYFSRVVMHMNPDGTEQRSLYGSGSVFPNSTFDIQPIPNHPTRFVGVISGHHGVVRSGRMIIFDPSKNRKEEKGMVQEIPFSKRPIIPLVKDDLVGGVYPQFIKPFPVNDKYFLVTAKLTPHSLWGLYLVDIFDNMTLITEQEGE
jgi:hypothetical protein